MFSLVRDSDLSTLDVDESRLSKDTLKILEEKHTTVRELVGEICEELEQKRKLVGLKAVKTEWKPVQKRRRDKEDELVAPPVEKKAKKHDSVSPQWKLKTDKNVENSKTKPFKHPCLDTYYLQYRIWRQKSPAAITEGKVYSRAQYWAKQRREWRAYKAEKLRKNPLEEFYSSDDSYDDDEDEQESHVTYMHESEESSSSEEDDVSDAESARIPNEELLSASYDADSDEESDEESEQEAEEEHLSCSLDAGDDDSDEESEEE